MSTHEQELLGLVLANPDLLVDLDHVQADDFESDRHRAIWSAIREVYPDVDLASVMTAVRASGYTQPIASYIGALSTNAPWRTDVSAQAKEVVDASTRRKLISAARAQLAACEVNQPIEEVVEAVELAHEEATARLRRGTNRGPRSVGELVREAELTRAKGGGTPSLIETGWRDLDDRVGGLPVGTLTIVAARPSIGKTAFCLSLAAQMSSIAVPVSYSLLEDTRRVALARLIAGHSGQVESREWSRLVNCQWGGRGADERWDDLEESRGQIGSLPLWIDDSPGQTAESIRLRLRDLVRRHGVKVAIVDHVLEVRGQGTLFERTTHVVESLRDTASELDIALVAAAQLRRMEKPRRPRIDDLKQTGKLDEAGRLIMLLDRPGWEEKCRDPHGLKVYADKVSEGQPCEWTMIYEPKRTLVRCEDPMCPLDQVAVRR